MPILLFLLTVAGAIAVWWWRYKMISEAVDEIPAAVRRLGFRRRARRHPSDEVEDPRLAAAGMLYSIARLTGDVTADQAQAVERQCAEAFQVDGAEAADVAVYGRWLSNQSQDPNDALRRLTRRLQRLAPPEAHIDLLARLEAVAAVGGGPDPLQMDAIDRARRAFDATAS